MHLIKTRLMLSWLYVTTSSTQSGASQYHASCDTVQTHFHKLHKHFYGVILLTLHSLHVPLLSLCTETTVHSFTFLRITSKLSEMQDSSPQWPLSPVSAAKFAPLLTCSLHTSA